MNMQELQNLISSCAKTVAIPDPAIDYDDISQCMWEWVLSRYGKATIAGARRRADRDKYLRKILRAHVRRVLVAQQEPDAKPRQWTYTIQEIARILPLAMDTYSLTGLGVNNDDGVRVSGTQDLQAGQEIAARVIDVRVALERIDDYGYSVLSTFNRHGAAEMGAMIGVDVDEANQMVIVELRRVATYLNRGTWIARRESVKK